MNNEIVWLWDDMVPDGKISPEKPVDPSDGDSLFEDDEWEDDDFVQTINDKFPNWYLVKMLGFSSSTFGPVLKWCEQNVKAEWKQVGWESGCSYSVGVVFESARDAMMFKLRWR